MFWDKGYTPSQNIEALLEKENAKVEEFLDDEDILQECKSQKKSIINYFTRPDVIKRLIELITTEPSNDLPFATRFRHSNMACEILTLGLPSLDEKILSDADILKTLYSYLENEPPLNPLLSSFFSKTFSMLFTKKAEQDWFLYQQMCLKFLEYIKSQHNFIDLICKHFLTPIIPGLIMEMIREIEGGQLKRNLYEWLTEEKLVERLITILGKADEYEKHTFVAEFLCDLIYQGRTMRQADQENDSFEPVFEGSNPILKIIESECTIKSLLNVILEPNALESSIISGISVVLMLIKPVVFVDEPESDRMKFIQVREKEIHEQILTTVIQTIAPRLKDFNELMRNPPKKIGTLVNTAPNAKIPFGNTRLHVCRLFTVLMQTRNEDIEKSICETDFLETLLNLFKEYCWNNFLHTEMEKCVQSIFYVPPSILKILESKNIANNKNSDRKNNDNTINSTNFARAASSFYALFNNATAAQNNNNSNNNNKNNNEIETEKNAANNCNDMDQTSSVHDNNANAGDVVLNINNDDNQQQQQVMVNGIAEESNLKNDNEGVKKVEKTEIFEEVVDSGKDKENEEEAGKAHENNINVANNNLAENIMDKCEIKEAEIQENNTNNNNNNDDANNNDDKAELVENDSTTTLVPEMMQITCETNTPSLLQIHAIVNCKIVPKFIDCWEYNKKSESSEGGRRLGYMGHLIKIFKHIKYCISEYEHIGALIENNLNDDDATTAAARVELWQSIMKADDGELAKTLATQNHMLANCNAFETGELPDSMSKDFLVDSQSTWEYIMSSNMINSLVAYGDSGNDSSLQFGRILDDDNNDDDDGDEGTSNTSSNNDCLSLFSNKAFSNPWENPFGSLGQSTSTTTTTTTNNNNNNNNNNNANTGWPNDFDNSSMDNFADFDAHFCRFTSALDTSLNAAMQDQNNSSNSSDDDINKKDITNSCTQNVLDTFSFSEDSLFNDVKNSTSAMSIKDHATPTSYDTNANINKSRNMGVIGDRLHGGSNSMETDAHQPSSTATTVAAVKEHENKTPTAINSDVNADDENDDYDIDDDEGMWTRNLSSAAHDDNATVDATNFFNLRNGPTTTTTSSATIFKDFQQPQNEDFTSNSKLQQTQALNNYFNDTTNKTTKIENTLNNNSNTENITATIDKDAINATTHNFTETAGHTQAIEVKAQKIPATTSNDITSLEVAAIKSITNTTDLITTTTAAAATTTTVPIVENDMETTASNNLKKLPESDIDDASKTTTTTMACGDAKTS